MTEEIAIVKAYNPIAMMTAGMPSGSSSDAGLGTELIGAGDIIIPRVGLLQPMSKAIVSKIPGAVPGAMWVKPHNRPATIPDDPNFGEMRLVIVRIFPSMRRWKKLDEGGGILCEAGMGDFRAREPNGLADAKICVEKSKAGIVKAIEWEGGRPTNRCAECVYGCGAAAAAAGRKPDLDSPVDRANVWIPKLIDVNGEMVKIPDALRSPVCTPSIDVLGLILLPPFQGAEAEIIPAFAIFQRTSIPAGKQLAGMVKIAARREPAWAKIFAIGASNVTNDKGSYFVLNARTLGYASTELQQEAADLYRESTTKVFRAEFDDDDMDKVHPSGNPNSNMDQTVKTDGPPPDANDKW